MCEPAHSIVQYPDYDTDDHDDQNGLMAQSDISERVRKGLGSKVVSWGRKIGRWFHFSKVGTGHSSAIELSGRASLILPEHTRYEGFWWERDFRVDGWFSGPRVDHAQALQNAKAYHEDTVMANMKRFRRFFEESVKKSDWAKLYVGRFLENVLTSEGRDAVYQKLRRVFGRSTRVDHLFGTRSQIQVRVQATKVVMGFTRKRELFLPHWADDDNLWTPG